MYSIVLIIVGLVPAQHGCIMLTGGYHRWTGRRVVKVTVRKEGSFRVECAVLCSESEYDMNDNLCRRRRNISS